MAENAKESGSTASNHKETVHNSSRRKFLKGIAALTGLGIAAKIIPSFLQPQEAVQEDQENFLPDHQPENLPEDILTDEELTEAHIRIVQSPYF